MGNGNDNETSEINWLANQTTNSQVNKCSKHLNVISWKLQIFNGVTKLLRDFESVFSSNSNIFKYIKKHVWIRQCAIHFK